MAGGFTTEVTRLICVRPGCRAAYPIYSRMCTDKIVSPPGLELGSPPCPHRECRIILTDPRREMVSRSFRGTGRTRVVTTPRSKWMISTCPRPSPAPPTSTHSHPKLTLGFHFFPSKDLSKPSGIRGDRSSPPAYEDPLAPTQTRGHRLRVQDPALCDTSSALALVYHPWSTKL